MSSRSVKVDVKYITRVEGHGNITVNVKDGVLEHCSLDIVESPRFFEGMLRGQVDLRGAAHHVPHLRHLLLRAYAGLHTGRRGRAGLQAFRARR